jgi:hypothetical protein
MAFPLVESNSLSTGDQSHSVSAERSTATAVMAEANSFGLAAAFLVGPNMISSSGDVKDLLNFYILCAVLISANLVRCSLAFGVAPFPVQCTLSPDRSVGLLSVASAIAANQVTSLFFRSYPLPPSSSSSPEADRGG